MKEAARNAFPNNGTLKITGFPCYELYVTMRFFLTVGGGERPFAAAQGDKTGTIMHMNTLIQAFAWVTALSC
jgi:hypothetical protein